MVKQTSVTREYLFDNGFRGKIEAHKNGTDIAIYDDDDRLILTESLDYAKNLSEALEGLLTMEKYGLMELIEDQEYKHGEERK